MTVATQSSNRYLDRPSPSSLADVIDTILDKTETGGIPELMEGLVESDQEGKGRGAIEAASQKVSDFLGDGEDEDDDQDETQRGRTQRGWSGRKTTAAKRSSRTRKTSKS